MEAQYPIRAVSKLTGLSIDTLRAWERRYAAVVPERSDRGRQYSPEQIQRLSLLRALVERGHAIGQIASLAEPALRELLNAEPPKKAEPPGVAEPTEPFIEPVMEALARFDHTRVNEELGRLAALLTPRDLIYKVALPLMRAVGEGWHSGKLGIAQEHLASSALRNLFGSLVRLYPVQPGAPKILIATLSGELHDFGILAAAMIASINGLDPIFLGSNLPGRELAEAAKSTAAEMTLVGYSSAVVTDTAELCQLAGSLPAGTELLVGGAIPPRLDQALLDSSRAAVRVVLFSKLEEFEAHCRKRSGII
jgi:MerR family transcriptional regulator, light-induced transcriptional regulator